MAKIQCKKCGGELNLIENVSSGTCQYCGSEITFPKVSDQRLENLYNRAEHFRRINDYSKAVQAYDRYITANPGDSEAYWGLVLSRFGIEYVEDPVSHERIPTCHRVSYDSILSDPDYLSALENAGPAERKIYEHEAKRIAAIQKEFLAIASREEPFDIFICCKESDKFGRRTRDSVVAQDIYYALTNAGYKVFFPRITLESKVGQQYEPYIFAALNSAKVMLVIGSEKDCFDAVWVRNEWSQFLDLMKKDRNRLLIPCYRDMNVYDIPDELSLFQAQDVSNANFVQEILPLIQRVCKKEEKAPVNPEIQAVPVMRVEAVPVSAPAATALRKAQLFVKVGNFKAALENCEPVLIKDPENAEAYLYKLMAEAGVTEEDQLSKVDNLDSFESFRLLLQVATGSLKEKFEKIEAEVQRLKKIKVVSFERAELLRRHYKAETYMKKSSELSQRLKQCIEDEENLQANPETADKDRIIANSKAILAECCDLDKKEMRIRRIKKYIRGTVLALIIIIISVLCFLPLMINYSRGHKIKNAVLVKVYDKGRTEFVIPDGVTSIGPRAFSGCTSLKSVTIPDRVTSIDDSAFEDCTGIRSLTIPAAHWETAAEINKNAKIQKIIWIVSKMNELSDVPQKLKKELHIKIPEGTKYPVYSAFENCKDLKSVIISDGVKKISTGMFRGCSNLENVEIPDSVELIEKLAFSGCSSLKSVTIPDTVTSIEYCTFSCCSSLKSVTIPDSVTSISAEAFEYCSSLKSVRIPDSVTYIGYRTFVGCSSLKSVTISDSVTSIGYRTFSGCSSLESVTIPDSVKAINWGAFEYCSSLESVTIPDSVKSIDRHAFLGCSSLKSVRIPKGCSYFNTTDPYSRSFPDGCKIIKY